MMKYILAIALALTASIPVFFFNTFKETDYTIQPKFSDDMIDKILSDPLIIKQGAIQFKIRCSHCHGSLGKGVKTYPDLTDDIYIYSNNFETIYNLISEGSVNGKMPAWKNKLRKEDIRAIAAYVIYLKERNIEITN